MWARVLARWSCELPCAKVALCCFEKGLPVCFVQQNRPAGFADLDHANRAVGTTVGAGAAADARAIVDADGSRVGIPCDCAGRAADHAHGIDAMHAGIGHHQPVMHRPLADEARVVVVRGRTCSHAIVAAGAAIEIDQHRLRCR